jgi:hypothetical protein
MHRYVLVFKDGVVVGQSVVVFIGWRAARAVRLTFLEYDISHLEDARAFGVIDTIAPPSHVPHHLTLPSLISQLTLDVI